MLYRKLRAEMFAQEKKMPDIQKVISRGSSYVSACFNGKNEFTMAEAYLILDMLGLPYLDLPKYFPPAGIDGMQLQPGALSA